MHCFGFECGDWSPSVWAAWIQAVFSVIAICVAIAVPWFQRSRQRRAEQAMEVLKARSLALLATSSCEQVIADVGEVLALQVAGTPSIFFGESARRAARVPEALGTLIPQLPQLGESGALLQDLILVLQGIASMQRGYDRQGAGYARDLDEAFPFIGEQFALAMRLAEEVELRLANLFDVRPLGALDLQRAFAATEHDTAHRPASTGSVT